MTSIQLSQKQREQISKSYALSDQNYDADISKPITQMTSHDEFRENHSFKITHVLIIAGITLMFLRNYQLGEPSMYDLSISA